MCQSYKSKSINKIYNLGSGKKTSINTIAKIFNGKKNLSRIDPVKQNSLAEISKLKKDTKWKPAVSVQEGIKRLLKT